MPRPLLFAVPVILALAGCGDAPPPQGHGDMKAPVGVATPIQQELATTRTLTGSIEAISQVELRSEVGGRILEVLVADGALVKKGDALFTLDPTEFKAALSRAEAERSRAQARLAQTKQQFERSKSLIKNQTVSQQVYDDAEAASKSAEAEAAAAEAAVTTAQLDLTHATVVAPISGRLGRIQSTAGNIAQGSGPAPGTLLTTLIATDPVYATFDLDETTWHALSGRLTAAAAGTGEVPVQVGLAGDTDFPHHGLITFVDNHIDRASGTIRLRATLANPDGVLTPGSFARISLEIEAPRPVLLVNERAISAQLNSRFVTIVDENGITGQHPVILGTTVGPYRVIESGIGPDDQIAVNNLSKIRMPGQPVMAVPASMETTENTQAPGQGAPEASPAAPIKPGDDVEPAPQHPSDAEVPDVIPPATESVDDNAPAAPSTQP